MRHDIANVMDIRPIEIGEPCPLPLYSGPIKAGFPSPAEDHLEGILDLNDLLIHNPAATFLVRVKGDSMIGVGILDGSVLVVDRSLTPKEGSIVVCYVDGEFTVKRFHRARQMIVLMPANEGYAPIYIHPEQDFTIWGVATGVVNKFV